MNYIRHLTAFYNHVKKDDNLTASHISLYMALFQYWNFNRFQNPFPVYRDNMMKLSKIGSKNTYHKCIRELHELKYIYYHPSPSKFLPVKVSIGRLDVEEEPASWYKQLDLFNEKNAKSGSPKIDTGSVPNLTDVSTDFDTVPVPIMGHNIKPNFLKNKTVSNTPTKIFNKNEKPKSEINSTAGVPNSVHKAERYLITIMPTLDKVEAFFKSANYPTTEAAKFFYYNQGRGWMLKDKVPIKDWQSLAHKWMLGIGKTNEEKKQSPETGPAANDLLKRFLQGQKIFNLITIQHFQQLQLQLTEAVIQDAWKERINQLTGTNQHSLNQLWDAYLNGDEKNELLIKDKSNLINLAKRIAVVKHFQQQKPSS
ncbi:MAG: hypothetical protein ABI685_14185 [Ferruginibacter sp.]